VESIRTRRRYTEVEKQTAITVCRLVLKELIGELRAKQIPITFESEVVTLGDLYAGLEVLTGGSAGWQILLKKAGRAYL
jgi:hypothetical protein